MKRKFKTGDWVRIKTGKLKGRVATIDQVLVLPKLDHSLYVVKWPDPKNIERSYLCAKNQYISTQLESTEKRANEGDNVYITATVLYGRGAIITKIQRRWTYGKGDDTPTGYKYIYTLRYVDPKTKESTTREFEHYQFSYTKPKSLPVQMVEFRPQDIISNENPCESKEPITFHTDEGHGHSVVHEGGAISWVRDWPLVDGPKAIVRKVVNYEQESLKQEKSKQMVDYNKKDVDNVVVMRRRIAWNEICFQYVEAFCQRHGYTPECDAWVGGEVGTTICINDMYIGMDEIRYDVDNEVPVKKFEEWYWKSLDVYELTGEKWLNYPSFCKGAPDPWPDERLNKIRESKKKIDKLKQELYEEIENYKRQNKNQIGHY